LKTIETEFLSQNPNDAITLDLLQKFKKYENEESRNLKEMLDNLNREIPPLEFIALKIKAGKIKKPVALGGNIMKAERSLLAIKGKKEEIEKFMEKAEQDVDLAEKLNENETGDKMQDALAYFDFLGFQLEQKIESLKLVTKNQPYDQPYTFKNEPPRQNALENSQPVHKNSDASTAWGLAAKQDNTWNANKASGLQDFHKPNPTTNS
jgi:hypothetical protein